MGIMTTAVGFHFRNTCICILEQQLLLLFSTGLSCRQITSENQIRIFLDYYDYYFDSDYFMDYFTCDGDFCMESEMWVESDEQTPVSNTELIIHEDDDYYNVGTQGILAECAPGLGVRDLAEYVMSCYDIEGGFEENWWTYTESCVYKNIGWLEKDTSVNVSKLSSIPGIADQLTQCMSSDRSAIKSLTRAGGRTRMGSRSGGQEQGAAGERQFQH